MEAYFLENHCTSSQQKWSEFIKFVNGKKNMRILHGNQTLTSCAIVQKLFSECTHIVVTFSKYDTICAKIIHCLLKDFEKIIFAGIRRFTYVAIQYEGSNRRKYIHIIIPSFNLQTLEISSSFMINGKMCIEDLVEAYNFKYNIISSKAIAKQLNKKANELVKIVNQYILKKAKFNQKYYNNCELKNLNKRFFIDLDRNDSLIYEYDLLDYIEEGFLYDPDNDEFHYDDKPDEDDSYFSFDVEKYLIIRNTAEEAEVLDNTK